MKRKHCFYLLLALFLIGFSGCDKPEQTELNINDSQHHATIQGVLFYPPGSTATDLEERRPVPNHTVSVDVLYSYYSSTTPGLKRFTGTTDNQGNFSIKIPVKIASTVATLNVEPFQGKHFTFEYVWEGGIYVQKIIGKDVIYSSNGISVPIAASKLEHRNIVLTYTEIGL